MTSTLLVTNPGSRSGDGNIDQAAERLREQGEVEIVRPDQPRALPAAIREQASSFDRIVLGGGDGTVNLALDALLEVDKPLGLLPLGTANDLARSLEIPQKLDRAIDVILAGHTRRLDAARVNDVSFINAIGVGLGPQMTREMDAESKSQLGVLAYLKGIVQAMEHQPVFRARIVSEDRTREGEYVQITIANGIHYGGGMTIADDAKLDDGRLDVLLVPKQSHWSLLGNALHFKTGLTRAADALTHWRCKELSIETSETMDVTADGEFLTETPLECRVIPSCLSVYAPALPASDRIPA
ncbi:MAG: lipid kinase [Wenzhouxiangella sp.]|nr:lipid kinase [Wenzhouxiangella sp.]